MLRHTPLSPPFLPRFSAPALACKGMAGGFSLAAQRGRWFLREKPETYPACPIQSEKNG
jgi:hypothetical protein